MKDEDRKLSEKEFEEKYKKIGLAPYQLARLEKKREAREKQEAEEQKAIEESVAEAKEQHEEELLAKVLDVLVDSEWYARIKNFIRNAVANSDTQMVQMLLVREKDDLWSFEAIVNSEKPKGVQYIKVNFGDES